MCFLQQEACVAAGSVKLLQKTFYFIILSNFPNLAHTINSNQTVSSPDPMLFVFHFVFRITLTVDDML